MESRSCRSYSRLRDTVSFSLCQVSCLMTFPSLSTVMTVESDFSTLVSVSTFSVTVFSVLCDVSAESTFTLCTSEESTLTSMFVFSVSTTRFLVAHDVNEISMVIKSTNSINVVTDHTRPFLYSILLMSVTVLFHLYCQRNTRLYRGTC